MIKFENMCCDCGQPCLGDLCSMRNVPIFICDECNEEFGADELYDFQGESHLCKDCLVSNFETLYQLSYRKDGIF